MHEKLKDALVLLSEIAGLLVIFVAFLLILNFFNILSLSTIYPNQFGFLPHLSKSTNSTTTQTQSQGAVPNNQSSLANFVRLQNQASDIQISKYQTVAASFSEPSIDPSSSSYISRGVFSGYDSKTIQVVTKGGVLNLSFDANTLFQKYAARQTNAPSIIGPTAYASVQDFSKNVVFGSTVQIWYSKPDLKATQVNYAEAIKPIL